MKSIKGLVSKYPYGYYNKAKGVNIWDIENRKLIDMGIMGVGTCILGYADEDVNEAVKECIDKGSMSTYNCYEDEILANMLLDLHPWGDKVRYARTGGEAMTIALKLAQGYAQTSQFIYCGYHGWHINTPSFNYPYFDFNDSEGLRKAVEKNNTKIILMEILRHEEPTKEFIETIKEVQKNCILVIDEITSGFRVCNGGVHLKYGLEPDIVVLGKAIGNGYPITAIIGKWGIMELSKHLFISSTFWTERIGSTAAIATIEKILKNNVVDYLNELGARLRCKLENIGITTKPPNSLIQLEIKNVDGFQVEMLKRGYIARDQIYLSYAHTDEIINNYIKEVDEIL